MGTPIKHLFSESGKTDDVCNLRQGITEVHMMETTIFPVPSLLTVYLVQRHISY